MARAEESIEGLRGRLSGQADARPRRARGARAQSSSSQAAVCRHPRSPSLQARPRGLGRFRPARAGPGTALPIAQAIRGNQDLYQRSLVMTHRDRAGDPPGRREAVGDAGHRQGFPTPSRAPAAGSPARPERRLPKAFGRPIALRWGARLPMSRIATPRAPGRKPWETVSMGHYQRDLVLVESF